MPTCTKCILPPDYPGVSFDSDGVCNFCANHQAVATPLGDQKLLEAIHLADPDGQRRCLVPLSGGKDSTYVLYHAVKKLGLDAVALCYDAGFQTDVARENIQRTYQALNVELITVHADRSLRMELLKQGLLVSQAFGSFVKVCGNCESVLRTVVTAASRERNIPVVLWGASRFESSDYRQYRHGGRPVAVAIKRLRRWLAMPSRATDFAQTDRSNDKVQSAEHQRAMGYRHAPAVCPASQCYGPVPHGEPHVYPISTTTSPGTAFEVWLNLRANWDGDIPQTETPVSIVRCTASPTTTQCTSDTSPTMATNSADSFGKER